MRLIAMTILLLLPASASAEWWEAETGHFIVISEDSEKGTREFALELERYDAALRTLQNLPVGEEADSRANKLTVFRFGDDRDMARMAGAPGSGIGGFFIGKAGDSVGFAPARAQVNSSIKTRERVGERLDELFVLKHEYTHYFMMQYFPAAYPSWYVEGYAEMMATVYYKEDNLFHVGDPPQHRAFQVLEMSQFPVEQMLDANHRLSGTDGIQLYGTGWLLTHYLNFEPTRLAQLRDYLIAIGKGEDSLTAAKRIFGDLGRLDDEIKRYRRGRFPGLDVRMADTRVGEVAMRRLGNSEEALIREEMRLRRGVDEDEASDVLADLTRKSAELQDDPHALKLLAMANLALENYQEADALGARIVELAPDAIDGLLIRSEAQMELIADDPEAAGRSREFATLAAAVDRADPRPLILYYYTYLEEEKEPPETAIIALETAFRASGSDNTYRLLLGRQLLLEDRIDAARSVLMPIAFRGHNQDEDAEADQELDEDEKQAFSMNRLLKLITEGDSAGALAEIDVLLDDEDAEQEGWRAGLP